MKFWAKPWFNIHHMRRLVNPERFATHFARAQAESVGPGSECYPMSHAVEPGTKPRGVADRPRPPDQNQEGGLKGVFHRVGVGRQQASAYSQDHGPVPLYNGLERRLILVQHKARQQLCLIQPYGGARVEQPPQVPHHTARGCSCHVLQTSASRSRHTQILPAGLLWVTRFFKKVFFET